MLDQPGTRPTAIDTDSAESQPTNEPPRIGRRALVTGGLALTAAGLVAGGSVLSQVSDNDLQFWNLFGGGDGERLLQMTAAYEAANPDVNLNAITLAWGAPYYTKLAMAAVGGTPPDVAVLHSSRLAAYAPTGLLEPFDPALLAEFEIGPDRFLPEVWSNLQTEGQAYAIPLDTHALVLYYRTDICEQAGLLDGSGNLAPLVGTEAIFDAFARAQAVTGNTGVGIGTTGSVDVYRLWWSAYRQLGGEFLSPDASQIVIDQPLALQCLQFLRELTVGRGLLSPTTDGGGAIALFNSGQTGFLIQGDWEISTFLDAGIPFSMVALPDIFGTGRQDCWADNHVFVLPRQGEVNEARRRASYRFIQSMLAASLTWAQGGHIPSYLPVAESPEYLALSPQSNYASAAQNAAFSPAAWFSGAAAELENQTGTAFSEVMKGTYTPEQGLAQMLPAIQNLIDTPSPI